MSDKVAKQDWITNWDSGQCPWWTRHTEPGFTVVCFFYLIDWLQVCLVKICRTKETEMIEDSSSTNSFNLNDESLQGASDFRCILIGCRCFCPSSNHSETDPRSQSHCCCLYTPAVDPTTPITSKMEYLYSPLQFSLYPTSKNYVCV